MMLCWVCREHKPDMFFRHELSPGYPQCVWCMLARMTKKYNMLRAYIRTPKFCETPKGKSLVRRRVHSDERILIIFALVKKLGLTYQQASTYFPGTSRSVMASIVRRYIKDRESYWNRQWIERYGKGYNRGVEGLFISGHDMGNAGGSLALQHHGLDQTGPGDASDWGPVVDATDQPDSSSGETRPARTE